MYFTGLFQQSCVIKKYKTTTERKILIIRPVCLWCCTFRSKCLVHKISYLNWKAEMNIYGFTWLHSDKTIVVFGGESKTNSQILMKLHWNWNEMQAVDSSTIAALLRKLTIAIISTASSIGCWTCIRRSKRHSSARNGHTKN